MQEKPWASAAAEAPVIPGPWRAALAEAWAAYLDGSLPIGACVADETGRVLATGRNRLGEARRVDGVIGGHDLAHAEINALLALPAVPRPECYGWAVYTTVEPCPQCMGALVMSGVRGLHYAAPDPWAGTADLLTEYPYMRRKGMRVARAPAAVERAALLLQLHELLEDESPSRVMDAYAAQCAPEVAQAHALRQSGVLIHLRERCAGLDEVLAALA